MRSKLGMGVGYLGGIGFGDIGAGNGGFIDDPSPNYSRPPSSTFRGYSFMNFRNDSISSGDNQMTFSDMS